VIGEANDPLLYLERLAYLRAVLEGIAALEEARAVRARAGRRTRAGQEAGSSRVLRVRAWLSRRG
jgi:hypothetical protein